MIYNYKICYKGNLFLSLSFRKEEGERRWEPGYSIFVFQFSLFTNASKHRFKGFQLSSHEYEFYLLNVLHESSH